MRQLSDIINMLAWGEIETDGNIASDQKKKGLFF